MGRGGEGGGKERERECRHSCCAPPPPPPPPPPQHNKNATANYGGLAAGCRCSDSGCPFNKKVEEDGGNNDGDNDEGDDLMEIDGKEAGAKDASAGAWTGYGIPKTARSLKLALSCKRMPIKGMDGSAYLRQSCRDGTCTECPGISKILECSCSEDDSETVELTKPVVRSETGDGLSSTKRVDFETKEETVLDFIQEVKDLLASDDFRKHNHTTRMQNNAFDYACKKLTDVGMLVAVLDFAMNWTNTGQKDHIQKFFNSCSATSELERARLPTLIFCGLRAHPSPSQSSLSSSRCTKKISRTASTSQAHCSEKRMKSISRITRSLRTGSGSLSFSLARTRITTSKSQGCHPEQRT